MRSLCVQSVPSGTLLYLGPAVGLLKPLWGMDTNSGKSRWKHSKWCQHATSLWEGILEIHSARFCETLLLSAVLSMLGTCSFFIHPSCSYLYNPVIFFLCFHYLTSAFRMRLNTTMLYSFYYFFLYYVLRHSFLHLQPSSTTSSDEQQAQELCVLMGSRKHAVCTHSAKFPWLHCERKRTHIVLSAWWIAHSGGNECHHNFGARTDLSLNDYLHGFLWWRPTHQNGSWRFLGGPLLFSVLFTSPEQFFQQPPFSHSSSLQHLWYGFGDKLHVPLPWHLVSYPVWVHVWLSLQPHTSLFQ